MRSDKLVLGLALFAFAACAKPTAGRVCKPALSWATPAYTCTAPAAAPEPEPVVEAPPVEAPPPVDEPPPAEVVADKIELREQVQFETGSPILLDRSKTLLDEVAETMKAHPELKVIEVRGHTDDVGATASNQKLSERRAAAVRKYLIGRGVAKGRLRSQGFGESVPIADNTTDSGRAENRRVELQILERE